MVGPVLDEVGVGGIDDGVVLCRMLGMGKLVIVVTTVHVNGIPFSVVANATSSVLGCSVVVSIPVITTPSEPMVLYGTVQVAMAEESESVLRVEVFATPLQKSMNWVKLESEFSTSAAALAFVECAAIHAEHAEKYARKVLLPVGSQSSGVLPVF